MKSEDVVNPITDWWVFLKTHFSISGGFLLWKIQIFLHVIICF